MLGGATIVDVPEDNPGGAEGAGNEKRGVPAVMECYPRNEAGSENGTKIGSGVEDAGGQRALTLREPLGDGFDGGREVAGFPKAEADARDSELEHGADERVAHCRKAPDGHDDHVADARADTVNKTASGQ